jgi:hypothetical protein
MEVAVHLTVSHAFLMNVCQGKFGMKTVNPPENVSTSMIHAEPFLNTTLARNMEENVRMVLMAPFHVFIVLLEVVGLIVSYVVRVGSVKAHLLIVVKESVIRFGVMIVEIKKVVLLEKFGMIM